MLTVSSMEELTQHIVKQFIDGGCELHNSKDGYLCKHGDKYCHQNYYRSSFIDADFNKVYESFMSEAGLDIKGFNL